MKRILTLISLTLLFFSCHTSKSQHDTEEVHTLTALSLDSLRTTLSLRFDTLDIWFTPDTLCSPHDNHHQTAQPKAQRVRMVNGNIESVKEQIKSESVADSTSHTSHEVMMKEPHPRPTLHTAFFMLIALIMLSVLSYISRPRS